MILICNIWIYASKACMQTQNTMTNRHFISKAKSCSGQRWCFFFSFTGVVLTVPGQLPKVALIKHTCPLHLKTNMEFLWLHASQRSFRLQRPKLDYCPDYNFSLHQSSVLLSVSHFPTTSFLLASPPPPPNSLSLSSNTVFKSQ